MDTNTSKERPEWLTDELIEIFRQDLRDCPNPYTDEDMENMLYDDPTFDLIRANARTAKLVLTEYGIPFEE